MKTIECIMNRHCYRGAYLSDAVPSREELKLIMEAGMAAPSGCNKQTTSFAAVDDPALVARIKAVLDPPLAQTAPVFLCVLTQRIPALQNICYAVQDYSAAIENMLLAITELGYQSCWYEGQITDEKRVCDKIAEILELPSGYEVVCLLPVGKAKDEVRGPKKKTFEERAWFNRFGVEDRT